MSQILIKGNPNFKKQVTDPERSIDMAEFFCDTIQGENFIGWPATFLRVQHCTQSCLFCDTTEIWRHGNPYSFDELFELIEQADLPRKFKQGQHLVLTGGSPVQQQDKLIRFINEFIARYQFKPYIEIENEATLMPKDDLIRLIDCWNNSPKLKNSYNPRNFRYQPVILKKLSSLDNAWFKFVVSNEEDWQEIRKDFLDTNLISVSQVVLMPLGASRSELYENREIVLDIAIRENVRYSTREQIVLWDKKTGV